MTPAGAAMCWGDNRRGQLGDGTAIDHYTPMPVAGLSSGVKSISLGYAHTCAVLTSEAVKCWGDNSAGELGDGTFVDRFRPVSVRGLAGGAHTLAAEWYSTCALTSAGAVKCWGYNGHGQLGDGTRTTRPTPVPAAGAVTCWGSNDHAIRGTGSADDNPHPVPATVPGLASGVDAITMAWTHACVRLVSGAMKCWGNGRFGALGNGATPSRSKPVNVSGMSSGVSSITAGDNQTCGLRNGVGMCWGRNLYGAVGDGTTTMRTRPVLVH